MTDKTSYKIQMSDFVHQTGEFIRLSDNMRNMVGETKISISIQA